METVIETKNLSKRYKDKFSLRNVNLNIEKGEIYGIVGPNGAGKSTLLKLLSGITYPTTGEIKILGKTDLENQRKRMSSIVENPTLFEGLSAKDNLEYFRIQRGIADKNIAEESLKSVGLSDTGKKQVKKFSVGMKQRLALALSLMTNPEILILDEPTSGIDPAGIVEVRHILQKLNKEKNVTILISSHILSELSNLATRIAIIDKGEIKDELNLEELYEKSTEHISLKTDDEKTVAILEDKIGIKDFEVKPDGEIVIYDKYLDPKKIVKVLSEAGIGVEKIQKEHKNLEEYYLSITGGENV